MLLTQMKLDMTRRSTMRALTMPNLLHGAVEAAFPGERRRRLWRLDRLGGGCSLLLLSEDEPELSGAVRQFGFPEPAPGWESRDYEPLLARAAQGSVWHFRLTANPTVSSPSDGARGRLHAHATVHYQELWLAQRAQKHGFSLAEDGFAVVGSQWLRFWKNGNSDRQVSLLAVTYEGTLTVTDAAEFQKTLVCGLGRGKAYGMGLLTIVSPQRAGG